MTYRDFKNFDQEIFSQELRTSSSAESVHDYTSFKDNFLAVLNNHTPLKKNVLRVNHTVYVTKALRRAIMSMSYLKTLYFLKKDNRIFEKL